MEKNINGLVKPVKKNGKVLIHKDTLFMGVSEYFCSTFIKNKNVLVKGELKNKHSHKRNAMIVLFNGHTGKIIGESRVSMQNNQKVEERHHSGIMCCRSGISSGTAKSTFWHLVNMEVMPISSN